MTPLKMLIGMLCISSLSACATTGSQPAPKSFLLGDAVKSNIHTQAIPASQEVKENVFIPADSKRQKLALERFQKDEVEKPQNVNTTKDDR